MEKGKNAEQHRRQNVYLESNMTVKDMIHL